MIRPSMNTHFKCALLHRQRGMYVIAVSAILGTLALMALSFSALTAKKAVLGTEDRLKLEVESALGELQVWYEQQADTLATTNTTPSEDQLKAVLSRPYPGLHVAMSDSMAAAGCAGSVATIPCLPWRKIVAWYSATTPPTDTVITDGIPVSELSGDAIWKTYSAQQWYTSRYVRTTTKMTEIGRGLLAWYENQETQDSEYVDGTNFWRATDCADSATQLPCIDQYTNLANTSVASILGLNATDMTLPLGSIQISNLQDSSTSAPYSVALRVVTPWGQQLKQIVLQP